MTAFTLNLEDGSIVEGQIYLPKHESLEGLSERKPLLVNVPGGSYTAEFFDADSKHSLRAVCDRLGVFAIALTRPGYNQTPAPSNVDHFENSFIRQSGRWLHSSALPAIWEAYASKLSVSSIVLYGHSIGGATCVVAAGEYGKDKQPLYKLSGLAVGGVGCRPPDNAFGSLFDQERETKAPIPLKPLSFPLAEQANLMLSSSELYDPAVLKQFERLRNDIYLQELYDIDRLWPKYWKEYAGLVEVPVLYTPGMQDQLWVIDKETIAEFGRGFSKSTWVSLVASAHAPHAIELSYQSTGYYIKLVGFAVECAVQLEIAATVK